MSIRLCTREYKEIKKERILDISALNIELIGEDEIFVRLMDYKDIWLSNYGRAISKARGEYELLKGSYYNGELRYTFRKNVFRDGKWTYEQTYVYVPKAVIEPFIINEDKANNIYSWHKGHDKADCYYKNLYPLNEKQYYAVRSNYQKYGDDSEEFILSVMNDICYKPDDWSSKQMKPVLYGLGYHGMLYVNSKEEAYTRWHGMVSRCYSVAVHNWYPDYEGCTVCKEWLNYSNFKLWYEERKKEIGIFDERFDLDKDILFKGNKLYSPETVCLVPKIINTLFINCRTARGIYPVGVYKEDKVYRACMTFAGKNVDLGRSDTVEGAFQKYKEYKEKIIKEMAEKYKDKIPDKVYRAMNEWKIEITD